MTDSPTNRYTAIIPHPTEAKVLVVEGGGNLALPGVVISGGYFAYISDLVKGIREQFGIAITVLRCVCQVQREVDSQASTQAIFVCEYLGTEVAPPRSCHWTGRDNLPLSDPDQKAAVEDWFAERDHPESISPLRAPWAHPGWWSRTTRWIHDTLTAQGIQPTGPMEPLKVWAISYVLPVPTTSGMVYFKAVPALFATESGLTAALAQDFPGETPAILAVDTEQNYLLLPELSGESLRNATAADPDTEWYPEAARRFARLQIACIGRTDALTAQGCCSRPLRDLPAAITELLTEAEDTKIRKLYGLADLEDNFLRSIGPRVMALVAELEAFGIPETLLHGDLHGGNIHVTGTVEEGNCVFFDWSDGAITHPFFDLITFIGVSGDYTDEKLARHHRYLNAYLEPWTALFPLDTLQRAVAVAQQLAPAYHAVSYGNIARATEPANRWELASAVGGYLKCVPLVGEV